MKSIKFAIMVLGCTVALASCGGGDAGKMGNSTPIDSTNVNGTAPATYGGNNPANDEKADSNRTNVNDTGTKASNVHNTNADSARKHP